MTAEERAAALAKRDGGRDYYYEGWAREESIASAIRAAEDEARCDGDARLREELEKAVVAMEHQRAVRPGALPEVLAAIASARATLKSTGGTR